MLANGASGRPENSDKMQDLQQPLRFAERKLDQFELGNVLIPASRASRYVDVSSGALPLHLSFRKISSDVNVRPGFWFC